MGGQQSAVRSGDGYFAQDEGWSETRQVRHQDMTLDLHVEVRSSLFPKETMKRIFEEYKEESMEFGDDDSVALKAVHFTVGDPDAPCAHFVATKHFVYVQDLVIQAYTNRMQGLDCPDDVQHGYDRFIFGLVENEARELGVPVMIMEARPTRVLFTKSFKRLSPMFEVMHGLTVYQQHGFFHADMPKSRREHVDLINKVNQFLAKQHITYTCPHKYKEYLLAFRKESRRSAPSHDFSKAIQKLHVSKSKGSLGRRLFLKATMLDVLEDGNAADERAVIDDDDELFFFSAGEVVPLVVNYDTRQTWADLDPAKVKFPLRVFQCTEKTRDEKHIVDVAEDPNCLLVDIDNDAAKKLTGIKALIQHRNRDDASAVRAEQLRFHNAQLEVVGFLEDHPTRNLRTAVAMLFAQYRDREEVVRMAIESFICVAIECDLHPATVIKVLKTPGTDVDANVKLIFEENENGRFPQFEI